MRLRLTCGAVDEDERRWVGGAAERVRDPGEGLGAEGEGQLGAGLGEAEQLQVLERAVADEGLVEAAVPGEHVGGSEVDAVLESEQQVQVPQPRVGVHRHGGEGEPRQGGGQVGRGGGLPHAALARGDHHHPRSGARQLRRGSAAVAGGGRRGAAGGGFRREEEARRERHCS